MTFDYEPKPLPDFRPPDMPSASFIAMVLAGLSGAVCGVVCSLIYMRVFH